LLDAVSDDPRRFGLQVEELLNRRARAAFGAHLQRLAEHDKGDDNDSDIEIHA
jgi:hypothetical protein